MKKFFIIAISILSFGKIHAQEIKKNGRLDLSIGIIPYKNGLSQYRLNAQFILPSFEKTRPKAHPVITLKFGSDEHIDFSTDLSVSSGIWIGTEECYLALQTGLSYSFNTGFKGWDAYKVTTGGKYCIARRLYCTYRIYGQYSLTSSYDFSHILIKAKQSDYIETKSEVTIGPSTFLSLGYAVNFFKETTKKDDMTRDMRRSIPIQHNLNRGFFIRITDENFYFTAYRMNNPEQKYLLVLGTTIKKLNLRKLFSLKGKACFFVILISMKAEELKKLNEKWSTKCTCELKKMATQPVYGNGNANTEIVFIGEAPGKKEDKEGIPFIGAAGKFLAEMLESIKMKREDIYITNIVKYRPPDNRDPEPSEKEACAPWLYEELNLIAPKLIVFLGRHSMNNFFSELKISDAHGKLIIKKFKHITTSHFLPLYHPAAALYNGGMRETLILDFKKIPTILKKIQASEE